MSFFDKAIINFSGNCPINPKKFPLLIGIGPDQSTKRTCMTLADVPQDTDFVILGTCLAVITEPRMEEAQL